eukprot:2542744-Pleurochrysis_carterae.AAC.2
MALQHGAQPAAAPAAAFAVSTGERVRVLAAELREEGGTDEAEDAVDAVQALATERRGDQAKSALSQQRPPLRGQRRGGGRRSGKRALSR